MVSSFVTPCSKYFLLHFVHAKNDKSDVNIMKIASLHFAGQGMKRAQSSFKMQTTSTFFPVFIEGRKVAYSMNRYMRFSFERKQTNTDAL